MGNRISEEMKDQFRSMVQTGVNVPSLSHYVKYVVVRLLVLLVYQQRPDLD